MRILSLVSVILLSSILVFAQKVETKPAPFLMPIEDVFSISGVGVIATGKVERRSIKVGEKVEVVGLGTTKTATVTMIDRNRKAVQEANVGDNVGINIRGVTKEDVRRGQVIAVPKSIKAGTRIKASLELLASHEGGRRTPIFNGYRPQLIFRTAGISGTVEFPTGHEQIRPGDKNTLVTIVLTQPVALENGLKFAIREAGRSIGMGAVIGFEVHD